MDELVARIVDRRLNFRRFRHSQRRYSSRRPTNAFIREFALLAPIGERDKPSLLKIQPRELVRRSRRKDGDLSPLLELGRPSIRTQQTPRTGIVPLELTHRTIRKDEPEDELVLRRNVRTGSLLDLLERVKAKSPRSHRRSGCQQRRKQDDFFQHGALFGHGDFHFGPVAIHRRGANVERQGKRPLRIDRQQVEARRPDIRIQRRIGIAVHQQNAVVID